MKPTHTRLAQHAACPNFRRRAQRRLAAAGIETLRRCEDGMVLSAALAAGLCGGRRFATSIRILAYHRICPELPGGAGPTWNVSPLRLRAQITGLLKAGYHVWSLRRVLEEQAAGHGMPPKTLVITFDDGYENFYTRAWPILKTLQVPATVFVPTAYLDGAQALPFDDWQAKGSADVPGDCWRSLTTAQCRELLATDLIEIGSHTHHHRDYRGDCESFARDMRESLDFLRSRFDINDIAFSYPYGVSHLGFCDPDLRAAARAAGATCGLTFDPEIVRPGDDPFQWGRFPVSDRDTAFSLRLRLNGWYSLIRRAVRRVTHPMRPGTANPAFPQSSEKATQVPKSGKNRDCLSIGP